MKRYILNFYSTHLSLQRVIFFNLSIIATHVKWIKIKHNVCVVTAAVYLLSEMLIPQCVASLGLSHYHLFNKYDSWSGIVSQPTTQQTSRTIIMMEVDRLNLGLSCAINVMRHVVSN